MKNTIKILLLGLIIVFTSCGNGNGDNDMPSGFDLKTPQETMDFIIKISNLDEEEVLKHEKSSWSSKGSIWTNEEQNLKYDCSKYIDSHKDGLPGVLYSGKIGKGPGKEVVGMSLEWNLFYKADKSLYKAHITMRQSNPSNWKFRFSYPNWNYDYQSLYLKEGKRLKEIYIWVDKRFSVYSGDTTELGTYLNGRLVGSYYNGLITTCDGEILTDHHLVNEFRNQKGEFDGEQTYYDECDRLIEKLVYDNGKKISQIKYQFYDWNLYNKSCDYECNKKSYLLCDKQYKDGLLDGVVDWYKMIPYTDKQTGEFGIKLYISESPMYKKGKNDGKFVSYWEPEWWKERDGQSELIPAQIKEEGHYKVVGEGYTLRMKRGGNYGPVKPRGSKIYKTGEWKTYYKNGNLKSVGKYSDNNKTGDWVGYDEDGTVSSKKQY